MEQQRTLRVGLTAILCALTLRMFSLGIPERIAENWVRPHITALIKELKAGQDVRFSPSLPAFSPDFVESPAPQIQTPEPEPLPAYENPDAIDLFYASTKKPDIAALLAKPLGWALQQENPTVLILHTHATESYSGGNYIQTSPWRTDDEEHNMLAIGAKVQSLLEQQGITVIQDRQLHDYPSYNGSYTHARRTIRNYLEAYPSIRLVLDLHRDASEGSRGQMRTQAQVDGKTSAQLMLVIGTNHEGYEDNLSLALKLHAQLELQSPGITRPLQLRSAQFNQDLCPGALLIEVGAAGNTWEEAMTAAEELAEAVAVLARGTK